MNDPELYGKTNYLSKRDAVCFLEKYANKLQWKGFGDRLIDIGCGDGSVTNILKKYMPRNFEMLVGSDVNENIVNFANERHRDDRTKYTILDIEGHLPEELRGGFDHVFSSFALHLITRQEDAFRNMYNLLKTDGDCLLLILGQMPIFDGYRILARMKKWHTWLKDADRYISPYHDSKDPEGDLTKVMEKVGFKNIEVKRQDKTFIYNDIDTVRKAFAGVHPFKIPEHLKNDFVDDYVRAVQEMRLIDKINNNLTETVTVTFNYTLLVAYGRKM